MGKKISWIKAIGYGEADDRLRTVYDEVRGPGGQLDNLYVAMGLRPHILKAADQFYRATLHDNRNRLPPWLAELIATYVGMLNGCAYVVAHHGKNFIDSFDSADTARATLAALEAGTDQISLDPRTHAILRYCEKLTRRPGEMTEQDIEGLRAKDLSDGDILEINQIAAGFAYWSRTINGLGITTSGETPGYEA